MPDLTFPVRGIDISSALSQQREGTCVEGENVQAFEPSTDRSRGGSRPGLVRFINDQLPNVAQISGLENWRQIQHLNIVVRGAVGGLPPYPGDDDPDYEDDPSSPGPSTSWPVTTTHPTRDWDGNPISSPVTQTRNPGPRKRKKKGNGRPPRGPGIGSASGAGSYRLFQCIGQITVTEHTSPIDFFGTNPAFDGCICIDVAYLRLAGPPTHMRDFNNWWCKKVAFFEAHNIPQHAYEFGVTTIIGNVSGDESTWGVRDCTPADPDVGSALKACDSGYDPRDNVASLGFADCCGLISVGLSLLGATGNTAEQEQRPGGQQSHYSCREEGE